MNTALAPTNGALPAILNRPIAGPSELVAYHREVAKLITDSLDAGVDYGVVPGTDKPTLLKPGAERLCLAFGARPEYRLVESTVDHDRVVQWTKRKKRWFNGANGREWEWEAESGESQGLYRYVYECSIVRNDGRIIMGMGHGVCSTMETKYVDRPRDCENTVLKMAQKRAFVAAVLNAFGLSNRFTQDVEEWDEPAPRRRNRVPTAPPPEHARPAAPNPAPAPAVAQPPRGAAIYEGTENQMKVLHDLLRKRDIEAECWEPIERELRGKPWTALTEIVPAEQKKFHEFLAAQRRQAEAAADGTENAAILAASAEAGQQ